MEINFTSHADDMDVELGHLSFVSQPYELDKGNNRKHLYILVKTLMAQYFSQNALAVLLNNSLFFVKLLFMEMLAGGAKRGNVAFKLVNQCISFSSFSKLPFHLQENKGGQVHFKTNCHLKCT